MPTEGTLINSPRIAHSSTPPANAASRASRLRRKTPLALACGLLAFLTACTTAPNNGGSYGSNYEDGTGLSTSGSSRYPQGPLQPLTRDSVQGSSVTALTPPADLWERMRAGFAMPDLDNELVERNTEYYASRSDYIARMADRSNKYLFHIVEELERRNMPTELALLPFVESAFNPQAVSSARAAGMWQFIPSTGKHFELTQNAFRDDRRDVLASTRAALDYLSRLHDMFGDWHLALAAYNWGEGSVQRAQTRNEKQGLGIKYTDLSMPAETRNYVPKLQALKNIVANPQRYGVQLPLIGNHPYFQMVDIDRDMDVAIAAQLAGVSESDFRSLNPSASKPLIMAAGTPQILLPWDNAVTFASNLRKYKGPLASWTVWVVPENMSPTQAAQRVGMEEEALRQANNIPARMHIRQGSTLLVTRTADMGDVTSQAADSGRIALAPAPRPVPQSTRYVVKRGDTLSRIAARNGVSTANLARWNKMRPSSNVRLGQSLVIYGKGAPAISSAPAEVETPASPTRSSARVHAKARPQAAKSSKSTKASKATGKSAKPVKRAAPAQKKAASSKTKKSKS